MNSIYRDNMNKLININNIAKIAYDMKIPMDEVVQRMHQDMNKLLNDWKVAVQKSKDKQS